MYKLIFLFFLLQLQETYIEPNVKKYNSNCFKSYENIRINFTGVINDEIFEISQDDSVLFRDTLNSIRYSSGYANNDVVLKYRDFKKKKLKIKNCSTGEYSYFRLKKKYQKIIFYRYDTNWTFIYDNVELKHR